MARKNIPNFMAWTLGRYPGFVYGNDHNPVKDGIPAFVFHQVTFHNFEKKLIHLKENGYETIDCSELTDLLDNGRKSAGRKVLLTFDDGHISLWQFAFPLLKAYDFKATAFVCPGLIPDEKREDAAGESRTLCNWREIKEMHKSGYVDFQSHGLYHDLVSVSSKIKAYIGMGSESPYMGPKDHLVVINQDQDFTLTNMYPYESNIIENFRGWPIYEHRPRYATDKVFKPSDEVLKRRRSLYLRDGEFSSSTKAFRRGLKKKDLGEIVSEGEYKKEIAKDLRLSKEILEEKLHGSKVNYFCPPWFCATENALRIAYECGYESVFLGPAAFSRKHNTSSDCKVMRVPRLSEKYILNLPT